MEDWTPVAKVEEWMPVAKVEEWTPVAKVEEILQWSGSDCRLGESVNTNLKWTFNDFYWTLK